MCLLVTFFPKLAWPFPGYMLRETQSHTHLLVASRGGSDWTLPSSCLLLSVLEEEACLPGWKGVFLLEKSPEQNQKFKRPPFNSLSLCSIWKRRGKSSGFALQAMHGVCMLGELP